MVDGICGHVHLFHTIGRSDIQSEVVKSILALIVLDSSPCRLLAYLREGSSGLATFGSYVGRTVGESSPVPFAPAAQNRFSL